MLYTFLERVNLAGMVLGQSIYSRGKTGLEDMCNGKFNDT